MRVRTRLACVAALTTAVAVSVPAAAPAEAEAAYGAIAINKTARKVGHVAELRAVGVSHGYRRLRSAKRRAKRECYRRSRPEKCHTALWVRNKCGAIARSPSGKLRAGFGSRRKYAIRAAKRKTGSRRSKSVAWVCSGRR